MKNLRISLIALTVILFDQLTKFLIKGKLIIVTNFLYLDYTKNYGISFGLFQHQRVIIIILSLILLFLILRLIKDIKKEKGIFIVSTGLLIGGLIGNLIDRMFLGYVVDFINLLIWPVFNLADLSCVTGAVLMFCFLTKKEKPSS